MNLRIQVKLYGSTMHIRLCLVQDSYLEWIGEGMSSRIIQRELVIANAVLTMPANY